MDPLSLVLLPIALGLLGFVEPCSMGTNLLFIKAVEARPAAARLATAGIFTLTRGLVIGALGLLAALLGSVFVTLQKGFWILLGGLYLVMGLVYLAGRGDRLARRLGPSLARLSARQGAVRMGLLFGLNVPACAAPLLFVLFGAAAGTASPLRGFATLALFGLALSLPLLVATAIPTAARRLDRLAGLSQRMPFWTGVVLAGLGAWSIWLGLFVDLEKWA